MKDILGRSMKIRLNISAQFRQNRMRKRWFFPSGRVLHTTLISFVQGWGMSIA